MEQVELPDGWKWVPLGKVAKYINGRAFKPTDWELEGLPIIRIQNLTNPSTKFNYYAKPVEKKYYVNDGDLLISWSATLDAFIWTRGPAILNQHIFRVEINSDIIDKHYLYYVVRAFLQSLKDQVHGTGMQHITRGPFEATEIPLAPLPEQRQIVKKIEKLFAQSSAVRVALTRVPALMSQFRRAVLTSAFRGELVEPDPNDEPAASLLQHIRSERDLSGSQKTIETVDTSDLPELPSRWVWVRFEELLAELKNGHFSKAPAFEPPGIPILRISAVRPMSVKLDEPRFFRGDLDEVSQYELRNDDLLFTRYNGSLNLVGVCGMVRDLNDVMIYPDKLIRARFFANTVLPAYLAFYFASGFPRSIIEDKAKSSAGQQGISGKDLKDVPVPLPPLAEQQRIAVKIEALFAQAAIIEQAASVALRRAEQIDQSILVRAFRGELD